MKKVLAIAIVFLVLCIIGWYSYDVYEKSKVVPVSERSYIAPGFYVHLNTSTKYEASLDRARYGYHTEDRIKFTYVYVPEWTLRQIDADNKKQEVAFIKIVPTGSVPDLFEFESLPEIGEYKTSNAKMMLPNGSVLWERVFSEKVLASNPEYSIRIEVPWGVRTFSSLENKDSAVNLLKILLPNLVYNENVLNDVADVLLGDEDGLGLQSDKDITKKMPSSVLSSLWLGVLQQVHVKSFVRKTSSESDLASFCSYMYENSVLGEIRCNANDSGAALLLPLDSDALFCTDTDGHKGVFEKKAILEDTTVCK